MLQLEASQSRRVTTYRVTFELFIPQMASINLPMPFEMMRQRFTVDEVHHHIRLSGRHYTKIMHGNNVRMAQLADCLCFLLHAQHRV